MMHVENGLFIAGFRNDVLEPTTARLLSSFQTATSAHSTHLPWIECISHFAQTGYIQCGIVTISIIWTAIAAVRLRYRDPYQGLRNFKGSAVHVPYELCSQAARAATSAFFVISSLWGQSHWANAAATVYVFILGLLRLVNNPRWRHVVLHQINIVSSLTLLLVVIARWLPCIEFEVECSLRNPMGASTVALALAVFVAFATPREWMPPPPHEYDIPEARRQAFDDRGPAPEETCSWLNYYCTYEWLTPTIWKGTRNKLEKDALPRVPWYDDPMIILDRVRKARAWGKTTFWTTMALLRMEILLMTFWTTTAFVIEFASPAGLYKLLAYIERPEESVIRPWFWLLVMFLGQFLRSVGFQQYIFTSTRLIVRVKSALTQELYHMALDSRELEHEESKLVGKSGKRQFVTSSGRLANLMAADVDAIFKARDIIMIGVGVPIGTVVALFGLYQVIGWPALVGTVILAIASPCGIALAQLMVVLQRKVRDAQDSRISVITEYLSLIRAIKYFAWEDAAAERIQEARDLELKFLWKTTLYNLGVALVNMTFPYIALFAIFTLSIFVKNQPLTGSVAFTTVYLVKNIRSKLSMVGYLSRNVANAVVAFNRLDKYFESARPMDRYPPGPPRIQKGTFRRTEKAAFLLKDVSLDFVEGGLNVVTGPSGSGKTTLLLALLGETVKESGEVTRPTDVGYASQSPWLQNGSLKDNILFTSPLEQVRYERIIEACCLGPDIAELPDGDATLIGENGTSLSGGQRARVALARAVYSKAPLLLFDDIFSALDAKTAAHVWELCFCSDLLKGRTTILVTQIPWISAQADFAIDLENGSVKSTEQHLGVVRRPISIAKVFADGEVLGEEGGNGDALNDNNKVASEKPAKDDVDDEMGERMGGRMLLFRYLKYFGSPLFLFIVAIVLTINVSLTIGGNLWLAIWTKAASEDGKNVAFYIGVYGAITASEVVCEMLEFVMFKLGQWYAARQLHRELVDGILRVSLGWYKDIPVGRVINRFSRDMASLDGVLGQLVNAVLSLALSLVFRIGAISSILPVFVFPAAFLSLVGIAVGEMYTRTGVKLRRYESSSQSPVFSQFTDTLAGLPVIRARQELRTTFGTLLADRLLLWAGCAEALYNANRWVGVRVDFVTALISLGAGMIALSKASAISAGLVGFSLLNATSLSGIILGLVRTVNEMEIELQSFDRVKEYSTMEPEEKTDESYPDEGEYTDDPSHVIPKNWPSRGEIEFRDVTIRYDPDGPDILSNINLKLRGGERAAIVGRTGSGKSTLVLSLLRFTHIVSGTILYDGVDITKVPRKRLREALTIIPQEAVLFSGTVESNLDPTGHVPKDSLQKAIESTSGIASFQFHSEANGHENENGNGVDSDRSSDTAVGDGADSSDVPSGLDLSTTVTAKGGNFSHGQRQVLSLCRALVRKSKLMLLDEATASMDYETDMGIQRVLRQELDEAGGDRTLVTIAHRLRTIIDYDTVVVMSNGKMVEVGSPMDLYKKEGLFHDMVQHSGEGDELQAFLEREK